ncbi:MAG TPA: PQQ-binding-like beta-propeller repeat protein [Planctomycetota bacterium]|nr:PQQ-binding-like beta-propeller repeat protein [Planctomycetota bacterium]
MPRVVSSLLVAATLGALGNRAMASPPDGDWPHWAGPRGDCTSEEKGLLREWPSEGPKVLWRIPVAAGSNHPSVAGDDLCYAQLEDNQKMETIKCVDANSGKEKWSHSYEVPPIWHVGWGELGVRATPTLTKDHVYTIGTFGDAFCFNRKTGAIVWNRSFKEESPYLNGTLKGGGNLEWKGFNGSLIPMGDKIPYFYWQGGNPAIPAWAKTGVSNKMQFFAYDAATGKLAWKFEEDCSPGCRGPGLITGGGLPIRFKDEDCLVVHGNRQWKILRLADGQQLWNWECSGPNESPAWACGGLKRVGPNQYLDSLNGWIPSLVECDFSQPDPKPKVLWSNVEIHDAITPPVICDGFLYGFYIDARDEAAETGSKPGEQNFSFRCTDLRTGKVLWKAPGFHLGLSVTSADGLLFIHDHQRLTLVQASPQGYLQKGRVERLHQLANTGRYSHRGLLDWSMPVISRGRLFVRTPVEIICYDIKDPKAR